MSSGRPSHPIRLLSSIAAFVALSVLLTMVVVVSVLNLDNRSGPTFHALMPDAAGLRSGDNVAIAGLDVGKVTGIALSGRRAVDVTFTLTSGHEVYDNTRSAVRYANLIGTRYLALVPPEHGSPGAALPPGATIPLTRNIGSIDLTAVFDGFQPLFDALQPAQINDLTSSIISIFQGQSGTVAHLVDQVGTITTSLAQRKQVIHELLTNLSGLLTSVGSQRKALGRLIGNFNEVVDNVAGQRTVLARTIDGLATFTDDAADLTAESQPAINQAIGGLSEAAKALTRSQDQINGIIADSPRAIRAFNRITNSGGFAKVYICNLTLKVTGRLNISMVPGLPAAQYPQGLQLPSGAVGDPAKNGGICR